MLFIDLLNTIRNQWIKKEDFEKILLSKLRSITSSAYENVPYYNSLFRSQGLKPEDIRKPDDIKLIPTLDKSIIQDLTHKEFISKKYTNQKLLVKCTSGSTGTPLKVYLSRPESIKRIIIDYRCMRSLGLNFRHKQVYFRDPKTFREEKIYQKLGFLRRYYISIFDPIELKFDKLRQYEPDIICGDPTILEEVSQNLMNSGNKSISIKPKFIISTSQLLSDMQKESLSKGFGAPVFNFYGAMEFGVIGSTCKEYGNLHLNMDSTYCEFIESDFVLGDEKICHEIVCTSLDSYAMPLIRYKLGDIVKPDFKNCRCERTLPTIELIAGRKNDYILTNDGKKLPPILFTVTMRGFDFIKKFRITQKKYDKLDIEIETGYELTMENKTSIVRAIAKLLPGSVTIDVKRTSKIQDEKSHKLRTIISEIVTG
jgi:phenylacetate-CoA ligase